MLAIAVDAGFALDVDREPEPVKHAEQVAVQLLHRP
jgi:hypothetical protein